MLKCTNCGAPMGENATKCEYCGGVLSKEERPQPTGFATPKITQQFHRAIDKISETITKTASQISESINNRNNQTQNTASNQNSDSDQYQYNYYNNPQAPLTPKPVKKKSKFGCAIGLVFFLVIIGFFIALSIILYNWFKNNSGWLDMRVGIQFIAAVFKRIIHMLGLYYI